jgi:hypothetical protein
MRLQMRLLFVCFLFVFTSVLSAKEVWLSIGGTTANGTFKTDARVFNPSTTNDIVIQAYYLPVGNLDNTSVQPISVTVPKRQMLVYNDVVSSLFHSGGLGAIRLKSDDDFVATQRIFAVAANGSLGQFVGGVDATNAKAKGVIIQLASSGTFRTNVGAANPNAVTANVTWRLYDKNNTLVGAAFTQAMPPYAVIAPSGLAGFATGGAGADLTDAWLSYTSDQPIVAYGSVIDNGTTDPTYIPASEDTGVAAVVTPPNNGKTFVVTESGGPSTSSSSIVISPAITLGVLKPGDTVTFQVTATGATHGFHIVDPDGIDVLDLVVPAGQPAIVRTVTLGTEGTYGYYCTQTTCSPGHTSMGGQFPVGNPSPYQPPGY